MLIYCEAYLRGQRGNCLPLVNKLWDLGIGTWRFFFSDILENFTVFTAIYLCQYR